MRRKLRMAMAQQLNTPPGTFFSDILGAVIRHIIPAVYRLDPVAAVTLKPGSPNVRPLQVLAIHSQRVDMMTITTRILLDGVEIRHAPQLPGGREWGLF
jgi:hypothetical protein